MTKTKQQRKLSVIYSDYKKLVGSDLAKPLTQIVAKQEKIPQSVVKQFFWEIH